MCAICGKYNFYPGERAELNRLIKRMTDSMSHRGPDDQGFYITDGVGMGHRRLSIIDLNTGKQPMTNEDGSVVVVFNGEIYNYQSLQEALQLKGHVFKTSSDTEVIVHAYEEYGEEFLRRLRGMFAIALWDGKNRTLLLARDRLGIKPLYFAANSRSVIFSSEIKGILQDVDFANVEVNLPALDGFLRCYFLPGKETIFKNINRILPGWYVKVSKAKIDERQYWDLDHEEKYYGLDFEDLKQKLDSMLKETVRIHMLSDVPIGFLLSGGVDSTALLSYAVKETSKELFSFTVGFSGQDFADERRYARIAARKFGTQHHDMTISQDDFMKFLPGYVWHMEEPVCEPPAIALYYVSKLASEYVKVLISGEGGDEAFAGYSNYVNYPLAMKIGKIFSPLRSVFMKKPIARFLDHYAQGKYKKYAYIMGEEMCRFYCSRTSGPFTFVCENYDSFYTTHMSEVHRTNKLLFLEDLYKKIGALNTLDSMLYIDTKTWLPDDLLVKADKITMANSVELRVPFLDHEIMEFAANVPPNYKVNGFNKKYLLKELFRGRVSDEILFRKKTGFPVPYEKWIRNDLHEYVRDLLLDDKAIRRGYFKKESMEKILESNRLNGRYSKEIFSLVVFEIWNKTFVDGLRNTITEC